MTLTYSCQLICNGCYRLICRRICPRRDSEDEDDQRRPLM